MVLVATDFACAHTFGSTGALRMLSLPPQLHSLQVIAQLHVNAATASSLGVLAHAEALFFL